MNSANAQAYYLLGFAPLPNGLKTLPVPPILAQLRIENSTTAGIVAWYRAVDRQDFEGPEAARNLADLNWLTPRVLAHESVVSKLSEHFAIYPARFGCLFSSVELLMQYAMANRTTLLAFFASATARQEWGVKFTTNLDRAVQLAAERELAAPTPQLDGVSYLKLKQLQRGLRSPILQQLHAVCDERINTLRETFEHVVVRPSRSLAQPDRETLLANVAVWTKSEEVDKLLALCNHWNQADEAEQAVVTWSTGPWPPYSFCPSLGEMSIQTKAA